MATPPTYTADNNIYRALGVMLLAPDGTYVAPGGGSGGGGSSLDRELVLTTYQVKTAFSGASVGDTITSVRVLDVSGESAVQVGSTVWRNETTDTVLSAAPAAANLTLTGQPGLTDAQLRASALAITAAALPLPAGAATDTKLEAMRVLLAASASAANQATEISEVQRVGTRGYGTPLARVASGSPSAQSAAITGTEVLLHPSARCFVLAGANPVADVNSIPLEAGEKFHLRITSGWKVAVIQDAAAGYLNIVPVA